MILSFALCVLIALALIMLSERVAIAFSPIFFDSSILYHIGASIWYKKKWTWQSREIGCKITSYFLTSRQKHGREFLGTLVKEYWI